MKLRRTMKAQSPKKKEKERKKKWRRRRGLRLGYAKGHVARISVKPEDM